MMSSEHNKNDGPKRGSQAKNRTAEHFVVLLDSLQKGAEEAETVEDRKTHEAIALVYQAAELLNIRFPD